MHLIRLVLNSYQKAHNTLIPFIRQSLAGYGKLFIEVHILRMFLIVDLFPPPLGSVLRSLAAFGLVSRAPQVKRKSDLFVRNHYKKLPYFFGYCLHVFIETPVLVSDQ